jgi:hypothetical protein
MPRIAYPDPEKSAEFRAARSGTALALRAAGNHVHTTGLHEQIP